MLGQAVYHKRLIIPLNQRLDIIDELLGHIVAFPVHPGTGHQLLIVGNAVYVIDAGGAHIGIVRHTVDHHHLARISFVRRLYGCAAHHKRLVHIHPGSHMGSASLQGGILNAAGLAADFRPQIPCQVSGSTLELLMAECIHISRTA